MTTKIPVELSSTPGIVDGSNATAITIDSSENVGIGETTPIVPLHISKDSASGENIALLLDNNNTTTGSEIGMLFRSYVGSTNTDFQITAIANGANDMDLTFASDGGTERMRIDSAGNVGVAITPESHYADYACIDFGKTGLLQSATSGTNITALLNNAYLDTNVAWKYKETDEACLYQQTGGEHLYFTAASGSADATISWSERMRINSDGHLLLGKTNSSVSNAGTYLGATGSSFFTLNSTGAVNTLHVYDEVDSAYRFYVRATGSAAGTIFATNTAISGASDERLKENIKDLETGLTEIMALKPRRFDWKEGEGNGTKNNAGFIAQEIETVLPELVGDYLHKELDDVKSVRTGDILPTLVKAVQEQQTIIETQQTTIDDLKSRIETLEAGE